MRQSTPYYSGRLRVSSAEGGTCYVTVHLSFLGDDPRNHGGAPAEDVDQQLRRSLDRLTDLVAPGRG